MYYFPFSCWLIDIRVHTSTIHASLPHRRALVLVQENSSPFSHLLADVGAKHVEKKNQQIHNKDNKLRTECGQACFFLITIRRLKGRDGSVVEF